MPPDAGLNTISFNIEIFDEKIRSEICPGKADRSYCEVPLVRLREIFREINDFFSSRERVA